MIPKYEDRREHRIWWSMVSKAAERSNRSRRTDLPESRDWRMLLETHRRAVSTL